MAPTHWPSLIVWDTVLAFTRGTCPYPPQLISLALIFYVMGFASLTSLLKNMYVYYNTRAEVSEFFFRFDFYFFCCEHIS